MIGPVQLHSDPIIEVMKMKVAAIVGSIRKDSYNLKLAGYIQ